MKILNPEHSVERIVQRMREAALRGDGVAEFATANTNQLSRQARNSPPHRLDIQPIVLQPSFQPHDDDSYHINDLLKFSDRAFVENAYQAILKRRADEVGYQGLIEGLRSGNLNKIDVLAKLRYSEEGRAKGVQLKGLLIPATTRKLYRIPLLGYILNVLVALARLPSQIRNNREFESHILAQQEILVRQINHIGLSLVTNATETARADTAAWEHFSAQVESLRQDQTSTHEVVIGRVAELTGYIEERTNDEAAARQSDVSKLSLQWQTAVADLWQAMQAMEANTETDRQQLGLIDSQLAIMKSAIEAADQYVSEALRLDREQINSLGEAAAVLRERSDEVSAKHEQVSAEMRASLSDFNQQVHNELAEVQQWNRRANAELALQSQRISRLFDDAAKGFEAELTKDSGQITPAQSHLLDGFFALFDEQFRGDRNSIKERLAVYLPFVDKALEQAGEGLIVDVGCGRGEWLELLAARNLQAKGIDSNRVLVEQCREHQFDVDEVDLIQYLHSLPDESVTALTAFHIVEHLSIDSLVEFLQEALRVLKPEGVFILETPNPRNVLVGTCNFYFDPTHRNPLPREVMQFMLQSQGFAGVETLLLNPSEQIPVAEESELATRFNEYFYGPMDYGLVSWKPASTAEQEKSKTT